MEANKEEYPKLVTKELRLPKKFEGPTFAELASEWKMHDEYKKSITLEDKQTYKPVIIPTFEKCNRFEEEQVIPQKSKQEEYEWIKVERVKKQKRELTLIEKYGDPDAPEEEETVWGGEEKPSHQTCWEDKR